MGANRSFCRMESPIGTLFIVQENGKIAAIYLSEEDFYQSEKAINMKENEDHSVLKSAKQELLNGEAMRSTLTYTMQQNSSA